MPTKALVPFPEIELDLVNEQLRRGPRVTALRPKQFSILRYLVEHRGQLVPNEELLEAVWPGVYVSEAQVKNIIKDLRKALGDNPTSPRYIETVHRRGYRFIGTLRTTPVLKAESGRKVADKKARKSLTQTPGAQTRGAPLPRFFPRMVGRELELQQLTTLLERVQNGERHVVFIAGEAGIGKTTLIDAFLAHLADRQDIVVAFGEGIEHYGLREAYLAIFQALTQLLRSSQGKPYLPLFWQYAPTWMRQMPSLAEFLPDASRNRQDEATGTAERMLREMVDTIEALTVQLPLVLVLDDAQWIDPASVDLLAMLARRRQQARILVLVTYRPVEVATTGHPLKAVVRDLAARALCHELPLAQFTAAEIAQYIDECCPGHQFADDLTQVMHQRTGGNPLFVAATVEDFLTHGLIAQGEEAWRLTVPVHDLGQRVPATVRHLIERQIEYLSPEEQRIVEVASAVGQEFSAAPIAAVLELPVITVETCCDELVRRDQVISSVLTIMPSHDAAVGRYSFRHALYQEVLYKRLTVGQRVRFHRLIGLNEEQRYREEARVHAASLAHHFEEGREYAKAVQYLRYAGQQSLQRYAYREAAQSFQKGLALLTHLPESLEPSQEEVRLQLMLGRTFMGVKGYADPAVEAAFTRVRELNQQLGENFLQFAAMAGLWGFYFVRAELPVADDLARQLLQRAMQDDAVEKRTEAHFALGSTALYRGDLQSAHQHLEMGATLSGTQLEQPLTARVVQHPGAASAAYAAWTLWFLGFPEQAVRQNQHALQRAQDLEHPFTKAFALDLAISLHQSLSDLEHMQDYARVLEEIALKHEYPLWLMTSRIARGWVFLHERQRQQGLAQMQQGIEAMRQTGAAVSLSYYLTILAEGQSFAGQQDEAMASLSQAQEFVAQHDEHFYEAEMYRVKGEILLALKNKSQKIKVKKQKSGEEEGEIEEHFLKAIDIARQRQVKMLELRSAVSLARLWHHQGKNGQAYRLLSDVYGGFTEGFASKDLQDAKKLLGVLNAG